MKRPSTKQQQRSVEKFNAAHEVGTTVRYWTMMREGTPSGTAKTRSLAQMQGGHTAVVWVEGYSSCIALTHIEATA